MIFKTSWGLSWQWLVKVGAEILGCPLAMLGEQALPLRVKHMLIHIALL
jgi:hypothetical protein